MASVCLLAGKPILEVDLSLVPLHLHDCVTLCSLPEVVGGEVVCVEWRHALQRRHVESLDI